MSGTPPGLRPYGFAGPVDYIERITYDIWNQPVREPSLIERYYAADGIIHLDAGDLSGIEPVIANTRARLVTYPDFHGLIDDTIWTGSESTGYRTSMRWTWTGTDTGGTVYGPPTHRRTRFVAIANCIVRGEVVVEEWLGANPLSQARQLGYTTDDALTATRYPRPVPYSPPAIEVVASAAGDLVTEAMTGLLNEADPSLFDGNCFSLLRGDDRPAQDRTALEAWSADLNRACGPLTLLVEDQYAMPVLPGQPARVATQWRLSTQADPQFSWTMISHHHLAGRTITAQWLTYDELALAHHGVRLSAGGANPPTDRVR